MAADVDDHDDPFARLLSRPTRRCCNDQQLDALILGDASTAEATALRAHLDRSPTCRARHDELRAGHDEWQRSAPPLPMPAMATVTSLTERRRVPSARTVFAGALAAAAAVVVAVVARPPIGDGDLVRTKGGHLKASFAVVGGADLYDGDSVTLPANIVVTLRGRDHGVVVVEARDAGATWRPLTTPTPWTTTTQAPLATTDAERVELRVAACDTVEAFAGDRAGCDVDGITIARVR